MKESRKIILNTSIVFLSVFSVLLIRTQTAVLSYEVARSYESLKQGESSANTLTAHYQKENGAESIVTQSVNMTALVSPKAKQVVMVSSKGFALTR